MGNWNDICYIGEFRSIEFDILMMKESVELGNSLMFSAHVKHKDRTK